MDLHRVFTVRPVRFVEVAGWFLALAVICIAGPLLPQVFGRKPDPYLYMLATLFSFSAAFFSLPSFILWQVRHKRIPVNDEQPASFFLAWDHYQQSGAIVLMLFPTYLHVLAAAFNCQFALGLSQPFTTGPHDLREIALWTLDLTCRGMFFDVMEHWDISFTTVKPNPQNWTFMVFSFCYRMYCSIAVLAAAINVVLYWRARKVVIEAVKPEPKP